LDHLILLIPCWEGQEPISKRSEDPRKTSNAGKAESSKTLDLNPPNREGNGLRVPEAFSM